VFALASLWLLSPFATGVLLGSSRRARTVAGRHYPLLATLGAGGVALVVLGAFVLGRPLSVIALALGGPMSGLGFWVRREDRGDDGPGGGGDDPDPPPPGGDWERIVREIERHVNRHSGPSPTRRPASPEPAAAPKSPSVA
jgi:hypothetical protein